MNRQKALDELADMIQMVIHPDSKIGKWVEKNIATNDSKPVNEIYQDFHTSVLSLYNIFENNKIDIHRLVIRLGDIINETTEEFKGLRDL